MVDFNPKDFKIAYFDLIIRKGIAVRTKAAIVDDPVYYCGAFKDVRSEQFFVGFTAELDGIIATTTLDSFLGLNLRLWLPECNFKSYFYLHDRERVTGRVLR